MAGVKVKGLGELQGQFEELNKRLQKHDVSEFCRIVAKELAARLLAQVIRRTPVGQYPPSTGKTGGTLRRGWTAKTEEEAVSGGAGGAVAYAKALPITKSGNMYEIEIINPVHYASYVEFGHRTRGGRGWVEGQFMLTFSEKEVQRWADANVQKKLKAYLEEILNGG